MNRPKTAGAGQFQYSEPRGASMSEDSPGPSKLGRYAELSQIGLEMVAPIGLGAWLDYWRGWGPWGAIAGAILGLIGGMAHLVAIRNKQSSQGPSKERRDQQ